MAFFFGDGFDLYALVTDAYLGGTYWDGASTLSGGFGTGRLTGSLSLGNSLSGYLQKTSSQNDIIHHFVIAYNQNQSFGGTNLGGYISLYDGSTAQCSIVFKVTGDILLTSGGPNGTVLATWTGGLPAINTWYGFEFEVVINNTTGSFTVRRNGNTSNDFQATNLNTRNSANNYANACRLGIYNPVAAYIDDFLWRSDPSSVAWVGDVRCYTRRPSSDASVAWTPSGSVVPVQAFQGASNPVSGYTVSLYYPFMPTFNGAVGSAAVSMSGTSVAGNMKGAIFADNSGNPGAILGTANIASVPGGAATVTLTWTSPVTIVAGTKYWFGFMPDVSQAIYMYSSNSLGNTSGKSTASGAPAYSGFPIANPVIVNPNTQCAVSIINITPSGVANAPFVSDAQQDGAGSYNYSSTNGQSDLYGLLATSATPGSVVAVTTRGLFQKSDAGTRNVAVQLKSGATTVQSSSTALNTSWGWIYRTDTTDPATGTAWTPTGVNNSQIGMQVTA